MAMANAQNCLPVLQQCMEKWSTQITCHSHCTWITNQECRHQRQIWDGSNCDDSYGNMWWNMYIMFNVYTTVVFFILYFFYVFWYPPTFATSTELMNQSIFPFSICMVAMPDKKKKQIRQRCRWRAIFERRPTHRKHVLCEDSIVEIDMVAWHEYMLYGIRKGNQTETYIRAIGRGIIN